MPAWTASRNSRASTGPQCESGCVQKPAWRARKLVGRVAELGRDASALGTEGTCVALAMIGRTVAKSRILILWLCVLWEIDFVCSDKTQILSM